VNNGTRQSHPLVSAVEAFKVVVLVGAASAACFAWTLVPSVAWAQEYRYNSMNKVDPFQPVTLRKTSVRGLSRLQDFEVDQLELVGTVMGAEITALILTPDPREGVLAKIGDRAGTKGGRIIAISRDKVVVREPSQGLLVPGRTRGFSDVVMTLATRNSAAGSTRAVPSDKEGALGFPGISKGAPSPGAMPGSAPPSGTPSFGPPPGTPYARPPSNF
jgi:hypothetical protein